MKSRRLPTERLGFIGISRAAIRNWRILLLASIGLLAVAWISWRKIPRLEDPLIEPPLVLVTLPYPGASAEDVESQVVKPVEQELFGMEGIDFIDSTAMPNYGQLLVRFEYGAKMETVTETVRGKVVGLRKELPTRMSDPIVTQLKMSTYTSHMVLAVTGNRSDSILSETAKRLREEILSVPGVATVTLRGAQTEAIRIRLDPTRITKQSLSVEQVVERIKLANVNIPGGELPVGNLVTLLSVAHELRDAKSVAAIPVGAYADVNGSTRVLTLGDVADVRSEKRTAGERMMQDGLPAVGLEVRFRPGENAVEVGERVRTLLDRHRAALPQGTEIRIPHDQPQWVQYALSLFGSSLLEGTLLVMLVITIGMGWRAALVVVVVLPLSMAGAVFGLYSFGMALEQVSIAGLIVALGLLVDDAVVVTESIQVYRDRGLSGVRAAVLGTARVFWANNGTTVVACASFLPLFFMGGDTGEFIRGLPTAVCLSLFTSLIVAQFLTPWIATFVIKSPKGTAPISDETPFDRNHDSSSTHEERNVVLRAAKRLHAVIIPSVIRHPIKVILFATALLVGSCLLVPRVGIQFFPKADRPVVFVKVELPRGTSEEVTSRKVVEVVRELAKDPAVRSTSALIGNAYPTVFTARFNHPAGKDFADVRVQLSTPSTFAIVRRLKERVGAIPGAKITIEELYNGVAVPHPITIRVQGDDHAKIRKRADEIKAQLRGISGTTNVSDTMSDTIPLSSVSIDADRAFRAGITPAQVGMALRTLYGEDKVTSFSRARDRVEVIIEAPEAGGNPLGQVAQTPISALTGVAVPLLSVGDVKLTRGYAQLQRRSNRQVVDVTADVEGETLASEVIAKVKPALEAMPWENGYSYSFAGEQAETEKSFRNLGLAAVGTLLLIFVVLVLMFGSLTRAMIVIGAVPFVLIGAIPGLYVTNNHFGFMAFLGLVALIGVYVNHKIYYVDRLQELIGRGNSWQEAIHQAGIDRLRPVVLTAFTAILGLLPLTLGGGSLWSPFGWVNVFGLAISIPLSLVLLPAFLAVSYRFRPPATVGASASEAVVDQTSIFDNRSSHGGATPSPQRFGGESAAKQSEMTLRVSGNARPANVVSIDRPSTRARR